MATAIGFDVYGTLVDPLGMEQQLKMLFGDRGHDVAVLWRQKQLEYTFRRGLMRCYENFDVCTEQALLYAMEVFRLEPPQAVRRQLIADYLHLPAFSDVLPGLETLRTAGYALAAFSNGVEKSLRTLLSAAGVLPYLQAVISVDPLRTYKPDPDVYAHLVRQTGQRREETWLVSSNPFDIIGAKAVGLKAAWIKRDINAVFDPWQSEPDIVAGSLTELATALISFPEIG